MEIHRSGRGNHADTIIEKTRTVIDMSIPRQICPYDKRGSRLMVDAVKYYVFGGTRVRMTRVRCEEFFEEEGNFNE